MQELSYIKMLAKDREDTISILKSFDIDILKLEKKNNYYIIWLGGINKLLYQKSKIDIETALNEGFLNRNITFR